MGKNCGRVQARCRFNDQPLGAWWLLCWGERRESLADAFYPGVVSTKEKRNVSTQLQADVLQFTAAQTQTPQAVERQQGSGCIRRATTQARLRGQAFVQANVGALTAARGRLQCTRCAHGQISLGSGVSVA